MPELVEASPSMTDDGSVILGKRLTTVYLLDAATGGLVRVLSDVGASLGDRLMDGGWGAGMCLCLQV